MKRLINTIGVVFIISLVLTQVHSLLRRFDEPLARTKINIFWQEGYNREVTVQWYLFFLFMYLFVVCLLFIATKACIRYSFKLTMIFFIGFVYWMIKLFRFGYNYDSGSFSDIALVTASVLSIIVLIFLKENTGKFKSLF